jgi:erythromycin esterase-like protein
VNVDLRSAVQPFDPATVLEMLTGRPRLLGLGEPTHFEDVFLQTRNELFRHLVDREGYRTIAIESDCLMGLVVDDYLASGEGTLDDVMVRGFSHEFGGSAANRDLVRWMRAYNRDRPAAEHLHFAGFDGPLELTTGPASPRPALIALHAYLAGRLDAALLPCTAEALDDLLGDDARWTELAAIMDPSRSAGRTPQADRLRLLADDLAALLEAESPGLVATSTPEEFHRAQLYGRTAVGLMRYHYWMADTSPGRLPRLLGVRSSMMAGNLLAALQRGPVLVFAQNAHLRRDRSSMRLGDLPLEWWSAGALADAVLGDDYAVVSMAVGTIRHRGVDTPAPDTIEGLLYPLPQDRSVIAADRLAALAGTAAPRVSPWFGYAPLDPARLAGQDAVVFIKDSPPA